MQMLKQVEAEIEPNAASIKYRGGSGKLADNVRK